MPLPICPAPMTPTVEILLILPVIGAQAPLKCNSCCSAACREAERKAPMERRRPRPQLSLDTECGRGRPRSISEASLGEFVHQLWDSSFIVRDQAVIGDLEDRGVLVLVDGDDDLRVLHARQMLDRARNTDGDVELRRDNL